MTTTEDFDPYYQWLGIPPKDQPPHYYRLLGVDLFEDNTEVISRAADRQMGHVRTFQTGKRAAASQGLLNEISNARLCLLDPKQKALYDAELKGKPVTLRTGDAATRGPTKIAVGSVFGEYVLLDQIGVGGKGPVFKAKHRTMGRMAAIKFLLRRAMKTTEPAERFRRKVKILAGLSHPNLTAAFDAGERDDVMYLIMEYIDGQNLLDVVDRYGPLPVEHAVNYAAQAAGGLGYAHGQGVLHRNVKPSNLVVNRQGVIKIIGLGLAGFLDRDSALDMEAAQLTQPGRILGTVDYMSPEQAVDSSSVDHRSDVYSLGCTLHALITGRPPYPFSSPMKKIFAHRDHPIPSLRHARPEVSGDLDAVFMRMLAKRPEQRYQSMGEVMAALHACQ